MWTRILATAIRTLTTLMLALIAVAIVLPTCGRTAESEPPQNDPQDTPATGQSKQELGRALFDGKTLTGWKATKFGGEGEVYAKDGLLHLEFGAPMTGVTYAGKAKLPTTNYEIRLEAQRVDGSDFFCGLTVPYKTSHFSYIVGGWGGGVVGISSIDGMDAAENETTTYTAFKNKVWYRVRLRVTDNRIDAWLDNKQVVKVEVNGRKITTRSEVDLSKPLGLAVFDTRAALRNIRLIELDKNGKPRVEQKGESKTTEE